MVSVLILTKNEEQDLRGCLESVSWCDDIHVFDSYSTDGTVEIARNAGAKITQRKFDNWAAHQNWGLANIPFKYNWVFYIDADERISPELKEAVLNFDTANTDAVAYEIQRRDHAWNGKWLKHTQISPFYLRLFRPDKMRYERLVNPVSIPDGPVKKLDGYLDHYPFSKGFRAWWSRHLGYADMEASMRLKDHDSKTSFSWKKALASKDFTERRYHQKGLFYKMPGRPLIKWFYMVVFRKGFLDGMTGITYATLQAIYEYFIVLRTRELINKDGNSKKRVEQKPTGRLRRAAYMGLSFLYTACLVYIFFFARRRWGPPPEESLNFIPLKDKAIHLQEFPLIMNAENIEFYKDLIGNVLLFIPLPFLLGYLFRIKIFRKLLVASAGISLFVETTQFIFNIGVADIDDLLLNTFGALIGILIMYSWQRILSNWQISSATKRYRYQVSSPNNNEVVTSAAKQQSTTNKI